MKRIRDMEKKEAKLVVFAIDILDYQSILGALKDCSGLFCSLDSPEGYDVSSSLSLLILLKICRYFILV